MKTVRIWSGSRVVNLVTVYRDGGSASTGATGGASNSGKVDIELDPWAGTIVDHSIKRSPVYFREPETDMPTEEMINVITPEMFSDAMEVAYVMFSDAMEVAYVEHDRTDPHSSALTAAVKAAFESAGLTLE